ncbi:MAG: hypothetical protein ACKO23_08380, partial [Gemmataceae bacterium]
MATLSFFRRFISRGLARSPMTGREQKRSFCPKMETLEDRSVPALLGNQLFPTDNPWNQRIVNAPVASNSNAVMQNIV